VTDCEDHGPDEPGHHEVVSQLGADDEPQSSGALAVVWPGDYERQEIWVASGANVGNWYCLGNEFRIPKVWDAPPRNMFDRSPGPQRPAGTVPQQPTWYDIIERGPVAALTTSDDGTYRAGWSAGRRQLVQEMESIAADDPPVRGLNVQQCPNC
jgi:hypothetical protein